MQAVREAIIQTYLSSDEDERTHQFEIYVDKDLESEVRDNERLKMIREMSLLHQQTVMELKGAKKTIQELEKRLARVEGQNALKANSMFGRQTEKIEDLVNAQGTGEAQEDPLSEDAAETAAESNSAHDPTDRKERKHHGKRPKGKRAQDMSKLPHMIRYPYDKDDLDRIYGEGNWVLVGWHESVKKGFIPAMVYAEITYTPIVEVGPQKELDCLPPKDTLLPGSDVTSSLFAGIVNHKFSLGLPLNRQERELMSFDVALSRQTMDNWIIRFSHELFFKVYAWMEKLLKKTGCTQSDETTLLVIRDGRSAGRKSFMWVHVTSELVECHPIVVFCYEPDRSTDHLREFYDDYVGKIICDAYCAYHTFESEKDGVVIICGCWMHARRRWAESLRLRNVRGLTHEQIDALPEVIALRKIGEIYEADQKLKSLSVEERLTGRKTEVRQKVDAYFDYLKTIDLEDPMIPERMKDAVTYSLNQREYLTRFLNDAFVPIDNGESERHIRPIAVGRNNWLFCMTPKGAEASAIMYSIVETARANGANVYYYLKYLLEHAPDPAMPPLSSKAMNELMPWSETYHQYEADQKFQIQAMFDKLSDPEPVISPRKKTLLRPKQTAC